MYGKLFASLYQGTLRGKSHAILVFTNLIAHQGLDFTVDKHWRAIADETGLTVDEVKAAIKELEAPDPESRSEDEEGRRIVPLDGHRAWGWRIVNGPKYRAYRNEEDRREQNRIAQDKWRKKNKPASAKVSGECAESAHAEEEVDAEAKVEVPPKPPVVVKEPTQKQKEREELKVRLGGFFNRRPTRAWSEKELIALRKVETNDEEIELLEWFYRLEAPELKPYEQHLPVHDRRRDLITLLNNWPGEVDKAKRQEALAYKPKANEPINGADIPGFEELG